MKKIIFFLLFFYFFLPKNIFAAEAPLRRLDIIETADGSLLQVDCHPASTNGLKGNIFTYTKYPNEKYQFFSYFISDNGICYGQQSFTCTADGSYVQFGMSKTNPKYTKQGVSNQLINNTFEVIKKQYGAYPKEVTGTFIDVNRDIMLKSLDSTPKNNPNRLFKSVDDTAASKAIFKGNNINRWYYLTSYVNGTATYFSAQPYTHTPIIWENNKAMPTTCRPGRPAKNPLITGNCILRADATIPLLIANQSDDQYTKEYTEGCGSILQGIFYCDDLVWKYTAPFYIYRLRQMAYADLAKKYEIWVQMNTPTGKKQNINDYFDGGWGMW